MPFFGIKNIIVIISLSFFCSSTLLAVTLLASEKLNHPLYKNNNNKLTKSTQS